MIAVRMLWPNPAATSPSTGQQQQVEMAEKLAAGAKTMSETDVGGGQNALSR